MKIGAKWAIGLHSDPAATELQASLVLTDGLDILDVAATLTRPYPHELHQQLLSLTQNDFSDTQKLHTLDMQVTNCFISLATELMMQTKQKVPKIDLIGLSGYGFLHQPDTKVHLTFGNAQEIAQQLQLPVVHRFVQEDLNAGGVGSPLLAVFWDAMCRDLEKPTAIIGLGGITRLSYIGAVGNIIGFDIGLGTILLDRWIERYTGQEMDFNGLYGAKGKIDERVLKTLLTQEYQLKKPPKAVQRTNFQNILEQVEGLSVADGAATLTAFLAHSIKNAEKFLPDPPAQWIFTGGGTNNPTLMLLLSQLLQNIQTGKNIFKYSENLDATGFAFLATRHMLNLPISFPSTTGVYEAVSVGTVEDLSLPT
ncbi:MAG: anhydro-N-acetylmuramic acid kinase [Alphaproteobacteria bacterium]|nr:anhydro-N-acetylmuramic acid kinase [Alphaproteobacteria bacterium]